MAVQDAMEGKTLSSSAVGRMAARVACTEELFAFGRRTGFQCTQPRLDGSLALQGDGIKPPPS